MNPAEEMDIKPPLFSVIIPHFEGSVSLAFLQRALESLHRQSFQEFEILLYHDGPKRVPFAAEIDLARYSKITRIEESAVRYNDSGHSLRDLGIRQAKGEYIIHMNADNLFYDFAFERIVSTMLRPRTNLIDNTTGQVVDTNKNDIIIFPILMIGVEGDGIRIWQNSRNDVLSAMILTGYPCAPGLIDCMQLVMRRKLWLKYGGWYDRSRNSDGPMYQRFVQEHRARYVAAVLGEHW
jgi:glycosyltransferase involved in cell wall biosynthesis